MPEIPRPELVEKNALGAPVTSVLIPSDTDPEVVPYSISFARYNKKECQIDGMSGSNAQAAIKVFRDIGVFFTDPENFLKNSSQSEIKPVVDDGHYSDLFKGCRDEDVKEIKIKREDKGVDLRLFFFTIEPERMFYIIATRHAHLDTSKSTKVKAFRDKRPARRKGKWR